MKVVEYDSSDHVFKIAVPTTVAEFDQLAKKEGAALQASIDHEIYHGTLGEIREAFCDLIEAETKVARREIGTGKFTEEDGKKVEITKWETAGTYLTRVMAEKNLDPAKHPFQKLADRLSSGGDKEVKFDPSVHERKAGPAKMAAKWLNLAFEYLTGANNPVTNKPRDLSKFNAAAQKLINKAFTPTGNVETDKPGLAAVLKEYSEAVQLPG